MNKKAIIESLKELARLAIFSVPAFLIQLVSGNAALSEAYGGIILFVLRTIDYYIHEDPNINVNGLLPF